MAIYTMSCIADYLPGRSVSFSTCILLMTSATLGKWQLPSTSLKAVVLLEQLGSDCEASDEREWSLSINCDIRYIVQMMIVNLFHNRYIYRMTLSYIP